MRKVACSLARQQAWICTRNTNSLLPNFQEGCQSSSLAEKYVIKHIEWLEVIKVKTVQQRNNGESALKKVISMRKIGPGAMVSLVASLQRKQTSMLGKQITAGQLTNH